MGLRKVIWALFYIQFRGPSSIIKKILEANKKNWHKKLINALWVDRASNKTSICISPFQVVYGVNTVFPSSLAIMVMKLLQESGTEENDI